MTLSLNVIQGSFDPFTQHMMTFVRIINKEDGKYYDTGLSHGTRPEWQEQFQFQLEEKQLNLTLQLISSNKQVLGQQNIEFKKSQFSDTKIIRECRLKKENEDIGKVVIRLQLKQGLKYLGYRTNTNLDISRAKLIVNQDVDHSNNQLQQSSMKQGMKPFGNDTGRNIKAGQQKVNTFVKTIEEDQKNRYDNSGIIKIQAHKSNLFSWLDDFNKLSFEFAPKQIRRSP